MNNMPTNQTFDNLVDEGNEEIKKMIFTDNTQKEENRPITNSIDVNKLSAIINEDTTIDSSAMGRLNNMMANNFESNSNNSNNNINNNFKSFNDTEEVTHSDDLKQIRSMMGIEDDTVSNLRFGNDFSFVPQFSNPNEERDAFINKITGIVLEEDVDNKGLLYLKITEPTGREEIYTGKHAVEMIKNFNKAYLDANPGKEVDTSLIDNFKEN